MVLWFIRSLFILLVISLLVLGFQEGGPFDFTNPQTLKSYQALAVAACFFTLLFGMVIDFFLPRKQLSTLAGIFFGMIVGILIGLSLNHIVELIYSTYKITEQTNKDLYIAKDGIKWLVNVLCCYLTIVFVMQTKDDFRFIIPYVEFSKQTKGPCPYILDTSVIIDGRIADIAATKIINSPLIVPRFVLQELQAVADSPDRLRRNRGRRGLDILNKMQENASFELQIQEIEPALKDRHEPVDLKLVSVAQQLNGKVVTNDYNLNKVASLRGVDVININDLANALKPILMPGENLRIKIVKPGDQIGQGVGYLDDGTMVVVENGKSLIGKETDVLVTSVLQTSAGRMIFGKLPDGSPNFQNGRYR